MSGVASTKSEASAYQGQFVGLTWFPESEPVSTQIIVIFVRWGPARNSKKGGIKSRIRHAMLCGQVLGVFTSRSVLVVEVRAIKDPHYQQNQSKSFSVQGT